MVIEDEAVDEALDTPWVTPVAVDHELAASLIKELRGLRFGEEMGEGVLVTQVANSVTARYTQDLASPLSQVLQAQGSTTTKYPYGLDRLASVAGSARTW